MLYELYHCKYHIINAKIRLQWPPFNCVFSYFMAFYIGSINIAVVPCCKWGKGRGTLILLIYKTLFCTRYYCVDSLFNNFTLCTNASPNRLQSWNVLFRIRIDWWFQQSVNKNESPRKKKQESTNGTQTHKWKMMKKTIMLYTAKLVNRINGSQYKKRYFVSVVWYFFGSPFPLTL